MVGHLEASLLTKFAQPRSQDFTLPRRRRVENDPGIGCSRDFQTPRKVGCNKRALCWGQELGSLLAAVFCAGPILP